MVVLNKYSEYSAGIVEIVMVWYELVVESEVEEEEGLLKAGLVMIHQTKVLTFSWVIKKTSVIRIAL